VVPDTTNGIGEIFARVFRAKDALCINDTCVNEDQLKSLLGSAAAGAPSVEMGGAPALPPAPAETGDLGETSSSTLSEIVPSESAAVLAANDNEPVSADEVSGNDDAEDDQGDTDAQPEVTPSPQVSSPVAAPMNDNDPPPTLVPAANANSPAEQSAATGTE
jgi:hypothetical protein